MNRRDFLAFSAAVSVLTVLPASAAAVLPNVVVAKSPTCGCCSAWVEKMRAAGFPVEVREVEQDELDGLKVMVGVPEDLTSCHTGMVEGYFIEGHVPPADVIRMLTERPSGRGLTVPGMPAGSPGMEMGDRKDPFDTILVASDGRPVLFERH